MTLFLTALALLLFSGTLGLFVPRTSPVARWPGPAGAVLASAAGLAAAGATLAGGEASLILPWPIPLGRLSLGLDPLTSFFLIPLFLLTALGAVYGVGYLGRGERSAGAHWFFYNLLTAGMALTVAARNGIPFLAAWEIMTVASYFLVVWEDHREEVRSAGWTYLVASQAGAAFLLAFFAILGARAGTLDFAGLAGAAAGHPAPWVLFLLALVGFGTKAGLVPLHVWLPEAHPAAPSHVSAVMSGIMVKMGFYGLLRSLTLLGTPSASWGTLLAVLGAATGLYGILHGLAQKDLKRFLAYSTVENAGLIALGLGLGLLGWSRDLPGLGLLAMTGALLHLLNHSLFKGCLFLGAGAVLHGTGTRDLDQMGGLLKRMPVTGSMFLTGALAASALPPLNGFMGELILFLAGMGLGTRLPLPHAALAWMAVAVLGALGGFAAFAFLRAFGSAFLGEPRSKEAAHAHEAGPLLLGPQGVLAAGCLLLGLGAPWVFPLAALPAAQVLGGGTPGLPGIPALVPAVGILSVAALLGSVLLVLAAGFLLLRTRLLRRRAVRPVPTWDCGYAEPTARMQYTASSFSRAALEHTGLFRSRYFPPKGNFPRSASLAVESPDAARELVFRPILGAVDKAFHWFRWIQSGNLHVYVLYIVATLAILLAWKLG